MKKILLLLAVLLIIQTVFGFDVKKDSSGRPLYAADRIKVKLSETVSEKLDLAFGVENDLRNTGIVEFDDLIETIGVTKISLAHRPVKDKIWEQENGFNRWYLLFVPIGTDIERTITEISNNDYIESANTELIYYLSATPNDTYFDDCWGHDNTSSNGPGSGHTVGFDSHIEEAWDDTQGYGSSSVIIAIIDTGVDYYHEDLNDNCIAGYDYGDIDNDPMDDSADEGHGTCCAGVAAGEVNNAIGVSGVAGNCKIMPLKISNSAGTLVGTAINNALTHCGDYDVDIASMSFGSYTVQGYDLTGDAAIAYAYDHGVTLLAATANGDYSYMTNPANDEHVIAVGAASPCAERKSSTSCDGESWWGSNYGVNTMDARDAVDVVAPTILPATDVTGSNGYSTGNYIMNMNGTSCATPYAAGVAALLKSKDPSLTPTQIRSYLTSTATDIIDEGPAGWDRYTGYGLVNAHAAVSAVVVSGAPGAPTNPTPSHGATAIDINTMISWTNGANTDDVDVYFSDNQALVISKDPSVVISSGTLITSTDPSGVFSLANGTDYYWRIVCNNSARAETNGPVWSFTTEGSGSGTAATLTYHNMDEFYFWHCPDEYGDDEFGVRYTPADACDLDSLTVYFNATVGSPTGITIHVYDVDYGANASGLPNTEIGNLPVNIVDINIDAWTTIDLRSLNLSFLSGDEFFITYTVDSGESGVTEVQILSDQGSAAPYRSVENYNGAWEYMHTGWGVDVSFLMSAHVYYDAVIPPTLVITPPAIDFMRTAIGGWKTEIVTLQNTGGGQVVIDNVALAGDPQIQLYDYNTYPDTLFSGETINFMVAYGPDVVGTNSATITVSETSTRTDHFIPINGEGYIHNSWASGTPIFDQPPTGNQGDNGWSMGTSDVTGGYLRAENFWGLTEPIEAIEFWGINWYHDGSNWVESDVEDPMDFEIKFYTDHATEYGPDTEVASFLFTLSRTTVDTVTFSSGPVYMYHADLPTEVVLVDGWVSVQGTSVSSPIDPWFLWSESPIGDHADVIYDDVNLEWDFDELDHAFALYAASVPPDPPVDVTVVISGTNAIISWTPIMGMDYNVYSDTDPYGGFATLEGTVTDDSGMYTDPVGGLDKKFYLVTADTGTRNKFVPATAPVLKKTNTIRSIGDSKLTDGNELKK